MTSTVSWNLRLAVREGRHDDARALMADMVEATRREPGAERYEWFVSEDGATCHTNEGYRDSRAVIEHLEYFGANFAERFVACFEPTSLAVYGDPTTDARAALDGFGAAYLGTWGGFTR